MMIRLRHKGLNSARMKVRWWRPTQEEWLPILLDSHPQFWKRKVDPTYQRPWKSLSPRYATEKSKKYPGQPILRATGLMQELAHIYTRGDRFIVRSTNYGAYNQFGTSKSPARPWMGVPDTALDQLPSIAWKHILR